MSVQRLTEIATVLPLGDPFVDFDFTIEVPQAEGHELASGHMLHFYLAVSVQPASVEFLFSLDNGTTFPVGDGHLYRVWPGDGRGFVISPISSAVRVHVARIASFGDTTIDFAVGSVR